MSYATEESRREGNTLRDFHYAFDSWLRNRDEGYRPISLEIQGAWRGIWRTPARVVGAVSSDKLDALCDLAELRTLESVQTNLTAVNVTAGPLQEDLGSLAERLGEIVTERRKNIAARYSTWLAAPLTDEAPKRASLRVL